MVDRPIPCGCATCGCLCPEHSPSRVESLCGVHALAAVARWIAGEIATICALFLLCSFAAVLGSLLALPG